MARENLNKVVGDLYVMNTGRYTVVVKCTSNVGVRSVCFSGIVAESNYPDFPVGMENDGWARDSFL